MSYSLSVVLLIPAAHKDSINSLAEQLGWGPNNLSTPLSGGTWFGCHTWADPEFLNEFSQAPAEAQETLMALVISVSTEGGGSPAEHWKLALEENQLTVDIPKEGMPV
jgi:hypothetical protein